MMLDFIIVETWMVYQSLLTRPLIEASEDVMSIHYVQFKFPNKDGFQDGLD